MCFAKKSPEHLPKLYYKKQLPEWLKIIYSDDSKLIRLVYCSMKYCSAHVSKRSNWVLNIKKLLYSTGLDMYKSNRQSILRIQDYCMFSNVSVKFVTVADAGCTGK